MSAISPRVFAAIKQKAIPIFVIAVTVSPMMELNLGSMLRKTRMALSVDNIRSTVQSLNISAQVWALQEIIPQADAADSLNIVHQKVTHDRNVISVSDIDPRYLRRGANFWFADSGGCRVATWVYNTGPKKWRECQSWKDKFLEGSENLVRENDTIFVPKRLLRLFISTGTLDKVVQPFVLMTSQYEYFAPDRLRPALSQLLVNHTLILKLFTENPTSFLILDRNQFAKAAPLPFGLQMANYNPRLDKSIPGDVFREAFFRHLGKPNKTRGIYYGYISNWTNAKRNNVPSGPMVPRNQYYEEVAASRFVLSPDGDRSDCYRNYEALALGAVPITELDPLYHSHMKDGPVVFGTTTWTNLSEAALMNCLIAQGSPMVVNRNMVFEEYWLEYMERIVGRPLRWWDTVANKPSMLKDFANFV